MEEKRPTRTRLLLLFIAFIVLFGFYEAMCCFQIRWVVYLYGALLLAAAIAYIIVCGGPRREPPTEEELPQGWDTQKRLKYLASRPLRCRISTGLLILIIPLLLTFAIDFMILRFFSGLY